jgi:hypothetical protein
MRITLRDMLRYYCSRMMHYDECKLAIKLAYAIDFAFRILQEVIKMLIFLPIMVWCLFETAYKTVKAYIKIRRIDEHENSD